MDLRVQKVITLMEHGFGRQLSLAALARAVNLSPWRLCHIFKIETRVTPLQYLRSLRMERAKILLATTFLSVKEIMTEVGVSDESHFVRDFKSAYGVSPARFRLSLFTLRSKENAPPSKIG